MPIFSEVEEGVWQCGSVNKPDLVMLHGWGGTGPANFSFAVEALAKKWCVTAVDLAGHGHGTRFNFEDVTVSDLAFDVVEKLSSVNITESVFVGYSLGGAVAQQLWREHPEVVSGLVLAATAAKLSPTFIANAALKTWASTTGLSGPFWGAVGMGARTVLRLGANRGVDVTNMSGVLDHNGPSVQLLARSVANFSSEVWIGKVDVPVGVLVCENDRVVPTGRQYQLAELTKAVKVVKAPGGHLGFLRYPGIYADALRVLTKSVKKSSRQ